MAEMSSVLPAGWRVSMVQHNAAKCLLPQSRPRVFFVGLAPCLRSTRRLQRLSSQTPMSWPAVDILDFLHQSPATDDWDSLTVRQQVNVMEHVEQFEKECATFEDPERPRVAIADVARDCMKRVESGRVVGHTNTLRTNCSHLWIVPSPAAKAIFGTRGRFLNRAEKSRCAGMVPESLAALSDAELDVAIGNTIPVGLIGTIMFPVVRSWAECEAAKLRTVSGVSR